MPNPPQIFDTAIRSPIALPTAGTGYATPALHHLCTTPANALPPAASASDPPKSGPGQVGPGQYAGVPRGYLGVT